MAKGVPGGQNMALNGGRSKSIIKTSKEIRKSPNYVEERK